MNLSKTEIQSVFDVLIVTQNLHQLVNFLLICVFCTVAIAFTNNKVHTDPNLIYRVSSRTRVRPRSDPLHQKNSPTENFTTKNSPTKNSSMRQKMKYLSTILKITPIIAIILGRKFNLNFSRGNKRKLHRK